MAIACWASCQDVSAAVRTLYIDNQTGNQPLVVYWSTNLMSFPLGHSEITADMPEVVTLSEKNAGSAAVDLGGLSGCEIVLGLNSTGNLNVLRIGATKSDFDWFLYGFVFDGMWFVFALGVRILKQVGHQSPEI
ncbi:MAG: hypothetical protein KGS61_08620 [Verrucomicrobia bacterium]|nr:hypothetical protein [Verrucomicrobiota bacterium]